VVRERSLNMNTFQNGLSQTSGERALYNCNFHKRGEKMNIPSFTAEASLSESSQRYLTSSLSRLGNHGSKWSAASNSVQPSMAIYLDGRYVCNGEVTDNGFINCDPIGGGPREPVCRPQCGPCRNHVKTCILRNCDDVERRC
jgi:hypothetical protein